MSELSATTTGTQDAGRPVVGIVMGSDSDWPVMGAAGLQSKPVSVTQ